MRKLFGVVAGLAMVVGSAGAQSVINLATRTVGGTASASIPATPGQITAASGSITGHLDTSLLSATQTIIYHLQFGPFGASATGVSCSGFCSTAAHANITFNGMMDDSRILTNGAEDGYGNEFFPDAISANEYNVSANDWNPGVTSITYYLGAGGSVPLFDQGNGASGYATATATLLDAYAVSSSGLITSRAVFDDQGNGYFTASTPEPSSLALLGTGMLGVAPFMRRRRRA